ncbi:hypothetical protein CsatA_016898 [Cannabis sativa]
MSFFFFFFSFFFFHLFLEIRTNPGPTSVLLSPRGPHPDIIFTVKTTATTSTMSPQMP